MNDTEMVLGTRHARIRVGRESYSMGPHRRPRPLISASLACLAWLAGTAAAQPVPLDARVVWVRGPLAYVASPDSVTLAPFSLLTFTLKKKTIASGAVERVVDGGMAVARITSGSLAGVKDLARLRVFAEPPPRPRVFRFGYPSGTRAHLLFACESTTVAPSLTAETYRLDRDGPWQRLVRIGDAPEHADLPETLLVRTFDDVADQEIALERGELDFAVFWPGELSPRMREHARWKDRVSWPLERRLIGVIPESGSIESRCATALAVDSAFGALGRRLFRGDLEVSRGGMAGCGDTIPSALALRYEVDPSCPGRVTLERFLNRGAPRGPDAPAVPVVRVSFIDPQVFESGEAVTAAAQCQLVCAPHLLTHVRNRWPSLLTKLFDCVGPERRP